jgi:ABC-type oligopeptide transport system substrate-binding subunit
MNKINISFSSFLRWGLFVFLTQSAFPVAKLAQPVTGSVPSPAFEEGESFDRYGVHNYPHVLRLVHRNAPKGGKISFHVIGSKPSSLNPFVSIDTPSGIYSPYTRGLVILPLMNRCCECAFEMRPCCAKSMRKAKNNSWITFYMDPKARFHDGNPVTTQDVKATFEYLCTYGTPYRKKAGEKVARIHIENPHTITFYFHPMDVEGEKIYDPEFPLILAGLPVLSKADLEGRDTNDDPMRPLLGNGPYRLERHDDPVTVYSRVKDFWGKDLPDFQGIANADTVIYHRFPSKDGALSAFRRAEVDVWVEDNPGQWERTANLAHHTKSQVKVYTFPHKECVGMMGFFMNVRLPLFQDVRLRRALSAILDLKFPEFQRILGHHARRITSFFQGTEYTSGDVTSSALAEEQDFLNQLPVPIESVSVEPLDTKQKILFELKKAGWSLKNNTLWKQGVPLQFTILVKSKEEKMWAERFGSYLQEFGVIARIREVDQAAYSEAISRKSFDMVVEQRRISLAPGAEQLSYWGSQHVGIQGKNYPGVVDPNIDFICKNIIRFWNDKKAYTLWMRTLDRVLKLGYYVLPLHYYHKKVIAHWKRIGIPKPIPHSPDSAPVTTYWIKNSES